MATSDFERPRIFVVKERLYLAQNTLHNILSDER